MAGSPAPKEPSEDRLTEESSAAESATDRQIPDELSADFSDRLTDPDAFELVTELAHDIRSPLNSILFLSEVLRSGRSGPVSEHQRTQLGLIYSASLGMISVVSNIMELATDRQGPDDEQPSPFSIARVFDSVDQMVRPMAEEKGLVLEFVVPAADHWVGYPGKIGRVILNLTTNALKFTEEGRVSVEARRIGKERVLFSVNDTGRGISQDEMETLFQPFRKAPGRSGHFFSGSGLGLSIARRLVHAMDSSLGVETQPGRGTRFDFALVMSSIDRP